MAISRDQQPTARLVGLHRLAGQQIGVVGQQRLQKVFAVVGLFPQRLELTIFANQSGL
jgi:hypothetical protein